MFSHIYSLPQDVEFHNIKLPIRKGGIYNRISTGCLNGFKVIVKCNIKDFVSGELRSEFGSCDKCSVLLACMTQV